MIKSKEELKDYLTTERALYIKSGYIGGLKLKLLKDSDYLIWHYIKMLRYTEYYYNKGNKILYWWYQRKKNIEGARLGISIFHNCVGKGLHIYHYGNIVINSNAKIGKNLELHGNNCIGNKGKNKELAVPIIGDNVDIGFGGQVLGAITIENNTIIGANAVVVKDSKIPNEILIGVPAVPIKNSEKK